MATSRRRFLAAVGAAAGSAGVAGGARILASNGSPGLSAGSAQAADAFSPSELLARHAQATVAAGTAPPAAQADPRMPSQAEVESWYTDRRNWGRWGDDDQKGAVNLITPEKSAAAAGLVASGRKVSLSRPFEPEQHFLRISPRPDGAGAVSDYYGFIYHGQTMTHVDALCHMWDSDGMWQAAIPRPR